MDWFFTQSELYWLDHILPEEHRRKKEDETPDVEEGLGLTAVETGHVRRSIEVNWVAEVSKEIGLMSRLPLFISKSFGHDCCFLDSGQISDCVLSFAFPQISMHYKRAYSRDSVTRSLAREMRHYYVYLPHPLGSS